MLKSKLYRFNDFSFDSELDLMNFDIYMEDISNIPCYDSDKNMELMNMISPLVNEMENIFTSLGFNDVYIGKNSVPWISDKVAWCLNNSTNIDTINSLKILYNDYCQLRDKVVCGNLRLVIMFARDYTDDFDSIEDIIQYGNMGLIRAIEKFDVNKGVTFNTYAGYWIKQSMIRGIKSIRYPMRIPMNKIYDSLYVMNSRNELSLMLGRTVTDTELCSLINMSLNDIAELLLYFEEPVYLDEVLVSEYDDKEYSRFELITDDRCNHIDRFIDLEYRKQLLNILSKILNEKEFMVIKCYFGLNDNYENLFELEIAKEFGVTQQRVHQIKKKALAKLHKKTNIRDIVIV